MSVNSNLEVIRVESDQGNWLVNCVLHSQLITSSKIVLSWAYSVQYHNFSAYILLIHIFNRTWFWFHRTIFAYPCWGGGGVRERMKISLWSSFLCILLNLSQIMYRYHFLKMFFLLLCRNFLYSRLPILLSKTCIVNFTFAIMFHECNCSFSDKTIFFLDFEVTFGD